MAHTIVHLSPAGTTSKITHEFQRLLTENGESVTMVNLGTREGRECPGLRDIPPSKGDCLWIGTPVYFAHPLWPVLSFLTELPGGEGVYAVPFVTYGLVKTAFSLYEMAEILHGKGYGIAAAAQFVAVHSMTLTDEEPLGHGRPDKNDLNVAKLVVDSVLETMKADDRDAHCLTPELLDYQDEDHPYRGQTWNIETLKTTIPAPTVDDSLCAGCGICSANCPMDNMHGADSPVGNECISCMNCVRLCQTGAVQHPGKEHFSATARKFFADSKEPVKSMAILPPGHRQ